MNRRRYLWGIAYGLLLTAFTAYILLDTFVIGRVYSQISAPPPTATARDV